MPFRILALLPLLLSPSLAASLSLRAASRCQAITVDSSQVVGTLKNLQGTENGNTAIVPPGLDDIHDEDPALAALWPQYGIQHVQIYNWPDVFTGFGKNGSAGNASLASNYNWTLTDQYVKFVTSHGAKASIQFQITHGTDPTLSTPEKLGEVGYAITNRYMNGAGNSGFKDALELYDFYVEADNLNAPSTMAGYNSSFAFFAGFAKGVARASTLCGVGAWGGNRILPAHTNYSIYDPYVSQFYKDVKTHNIPIKAATYHFTNAQFSLNPYDIKNITDQFRQEILIPAGLPNLPIWVTQFEPNPSGTQPTSAQAIKDYNDPSFFSSFTLATSMYAQDTTNLEQAFPWTGFGKGGTGAGNAPFQAWFNSSSSGLIPLNVAYAWKYQASLVTTTPQRLSLTGSSPNGFVALAGRSQDSKTVQILLNNYQPNYDIAREIATQLTKYMNTSTTAYPLIQSNGLFNGYQACFNAGNPLFYIPLCQSYLQAFIRDNTATSYNLKVNKLPWAADQAWKLVVQRIGGGSVNKTVLARTGKGNSIEFELAFPANAQDLVTITAA